LVLTVIVRPAQYAGPGEDAPCFGSPLLKMMEGVELARRGDDAAADDAFAMAKSTTKDDNPEVREHPHAHPRIVPALLTRSQPFYYFGLSCENLNRRSAARNAYDKAIEFNPEHVGALVRRGMLCMDMKDKDGAVADLSAAVAAAPRAVAPRLARASLFATLKVRAAY
jgi:tetratricopeptide (TPR) repeat protein